MAKEVKHFQKVDLTAGELPPALVAHLLGGEKSSHPVGLVRDGNRILLRCGLRPEKG